MNDPDLTNIKEWDLGDFFAGPMKGTKIEGHQVGVVINAEASLLAYREDLFERFNQRCS